MEEVTVKTEAPLRLAPEHPAVRSAGRLAQFWTPVVSSFAYHHLHHAFPKVPTALLPAMAKRLGGAQYKTHVYEEGEIERAVVKPPEM